MTSKIVVNNIEADAGVSTVTFNSNVERGSSNLHSTGLNVNDTFVHSTGIALGAGSTVGAVTGVTTYYGDGSQLSGISVDTTKIETGNTKIETIDTGSDGHIKATTEGSERLRITSAGHMGLGVNNPTKRLTVQAGSNNADIALFTGNDLNRGLLISTVAANSQNDMGVVYHAHGQHGGSYLGEHIFKTNNAERFRIYKDGYVTKPNQPGFGASNMNGWTNIGGTTYAVTSYGTVHHNYGSHFNSSNGRFTAPVDGRYLIHAIGMGVNNTYPHIAFGINNSSSGGGPSRGGTNYGNNNMWSHPNNSGYWVCITHILDLSANDYVRVYTYDWNSSQDAARTYFYGCLLG